MYHYTYLIQSIDSEMRYIGVRSSKVLPIEDTNYWGSSKHLPKDVKSTHRKIILQVHPTRKLAIAHEIRMRILNDVATNPIYYNKAKQTSVGFDTSGVSMKFTEEHKKNLSKSQKEYTSKPDYVNPRKGVTVLESSRLKASRVKLERGKEKGINNPSFKEWFLYNTGTKVRTLFSSTTKEEYSLSLGLNRMAIQRALQRSMGVRILTRGHFKGYIIGNRVVDT